MWILPTGIGINKLKTLYKRFPTNTVHRYVTDRGIINKENCTYLDGFWRLIKGKKHKS